MKTKLTIFILLSVNLLYSQNFWEKTNFPSDNSQLFSVYSLMVNSEDHILAGTFAKGIYKSTDLGNSWAVSGLSGQWIRDFAINSSYEIFITSVGSQFGDGVYKSVDNGNTWTKVWDAISSGMNCLYIDQQNVIYVGMNYYDSQGGIFRSEDGGNTWTNIFELPANIYEIVKLNNGRILAASYGQIYFSDDNGVNWNSTSSGLVQATISDIALNQENEIFITTLGYGIYKSIDNGLTWITKMGAGWDFSCLKISSDGKIYAATQGNWLYESDDNGDNWFLVNGGLNDSKYILSLEITKSGFLFAGMDYYGIYKSANKVVTTLNEENTVPSKFELMQNYPNPFNPSTSIEYSVPSNEYVLLKVYDLLGNEVNTLVNERQSAGNYEVNFDASNLASGIYFYRIQSGSFIQTKKLMLLK